jgi:mannose-6-phosphate isomerase-like protein (cupin superfamily)
MASHTMARMEEGISRTRVRLDEGERFLSLRRELGVSSFGLNLIVLEPRQRLRIHRHRDQEEVYLVLEGTLSLSIEDEETTLGRGELVRVAPEVRRQLANRGPDQLALLAIGGGREHPGRDGIAYRSWEEEEGAPPQEIPLPEDLPASGG